MGGLQVPSAAGKWAGTDVHSSSGFARFWGVRALVCFLSADLL